MGPNPLTYPDVVAWEQCTGIVPTRWERELLFRTDGVWLTALQPRTKAR
jgi:hypothetical protein